MSFRPPIGKFFGECTDLKVKLHRCFREEKAVNRKANFEQSKKLRERLQAYRKEAAETDLGDFFAPGITMYDGPITSFFGSSSWDQRYEHHNGEELPYEDCENWIPDDDAHFSTCWEDYFPKFSDSFTGNSNLNAEQETGDFLQSEDQISDANMAGETTPAAPSYDDAAPGYEYWLEQLWEEHTAQDQQEDPRTYSDEGICLDIFGYWPCMSQRDPGSLW